MMFIRITTFIFNEGLHRLCWRRFSTTIQEKPVKCKRRIFSGIQPTGTIHLGNYFGAVKPWIRMQQEMDSKDSDIEDMRISVVDLHSLTLSQDPTALKGNIYNMTACLIACGLDFEKSNLFLQSMVPEHTQLSWILGCMTTMARLKHLPQYKEKVALVKDGLVGIFLYPVLQSADILIYKANSVPVGEDQLQQVELAQHLAHTFNNRYGYYFPKPAALLGSDMASRIMSLRNPTKKMSKSEPDTKSRIELTDSSDEILNKIKKSVTDCTSTVYYDKENRPGVSNLIDIWCLCTGDTVSDAIKNAEGMDTGQFKLKVAEVVVEELRHIREKALSLMSDKSYLDKMLATQSIKAREVASSTWRDVSKLVGFG